MLEQLFEKINSELLTDEVQLEMTAMFESAVNTAIEAKEAELEESNKGEIAEFKDDLVTKLDEYLTYFVEEFTRENEQQIEDAVKVKTAQRVLDTFEGIVQEFNIKLDENVVADTEALDAANVTINEQTEELLALRKDAVGIKAAAIVEGIANDLDSDAKQEKFRALAETITFSDDDEFAKKLGVLAESVKEVAPSPTPMPEPSDPDPNPEPDARMSGYLSNLKTVV